MGVLMASVAKAFGWRFQELTMIQRVVAGFYLQAEFLVYQRWPLLRKRLKLAGNKGDQASIMAALVSRFPSENCICVLGNIFVHWEMYLCTGKYICALQIYLHTANIFVHWNLIHALRNVLVHWEIYLCTGKCICALRYIYLCTEKYICALRTNICALKNKLVNCKIYLCTAHMGHRMLQHICVTFSSD